MSAPRPSQVTCYLEEARLHPASGDGHGSIRCKFVVLDVRGVLAFVFGPADRLPYHANLVDRFCSDHGIAASWVKRPDQVEVHERGVKVLGGGDLTCAPAERTMLLAGASRAYGFFPHDSVKHLVSTDPFFSEFIVRVK